MTSSGGITPAGTAPIGAAVAKGRDTRTPLLIGGVVVLIAAFGISQMFRDGPLDIQTFDERQITSALGLEFEPSISPDGERVVYSRGRPYATRPFVQVLSGGSSVAVGEGLEGYQRAPGWNMAGDSVYFWTYPEVGATPGYRSSAMLGGAARRVDLSALRSRIAWSRDGTQIVVGDGDRVVVRDMVSGLDTSLPIDTSAHSFAWSPAGDRIAFVLGSFLWMDDNVLGDIGPSVIQVVLADGSAEPVDIVAGEEALNLNASPVWLDDRHLLFVSDREAARAVYVVPVGRRDAAGPIRRLPGAVDPHTISVSADGKRLAYSRFNYTRNIFAFDPTGGLPLSFDDGRRITSGTELIERVEISPDNEWIAFDSHINGHHDVFRMRRDGSERTAITSDPSDNYLRKWSPDGEELTVSALPTTPANPFGLYGQGFVYADGSGGIRTFKDTGWGVWRPHTWSPSGLDLLLGFPAPEGFQIWLARRDAPDAEWSDPTFLIDGCNWPDWSPDAQRIACSYDSKRSWIDSVGVYTRSGDLVRIFRSDALAFLQRPQFSPDGSRIYVYAITRDGAQGVWAFPIAGGEPSPVILNRDGPLWANLFSFEIGPDGMIYLAIGEYESDIWVVDLTW
jgi:Tol biopolymer transport system component